MTLTGISIAISKISQSPLLSKIPQMNFFNTQIAPKSLSITVPRFLSNLEFRRFLPQDPELCLETECLNEFKKIIEKSWKSMKKLE